MSKKKSSERRSHKRLSKEIPIELAIFPINLEGKTVHKTRTLNVSCTGFYCKVDRYIPLFTKVNVVFFNHGQKNNNKNPSKNTTSFQGVVVRIEPEKEMKTCHEYYIAIFFPDGIDIQKTNIDNFNI